MAILMFSGRFKTASGQVQEMSGPTDWSEMTVGTFERLCTEWKDREDLTKMMSIMYDINYDILLTASDKLVNPLAQAIKFFVMEEMPEYRVALVPKELCGIKVPDRIESQAFGKAIMLKTMITKPFEENISLLVAIYLTEGKFSMDKARHLQVQIKKQPLHLVYPLAFFCSSTLTLPGYVQMIGLRLSKLLGRNTGKSFLGWQTPANSTRI